MSSDADYASFLDKANQATGGTNSTSKKGTPSAKLVDTDVPPGLQGIEATYISDADEPFEPICLKWAEDTFPTEGQFGKLIDYHGPSSIITRIQFDPNGDYNTVVKAVENVADGGEIKVYEIKHGSTRIEYFLIGLEVKKQRLVGLKALAVES